MKFGFGLGLVYYWREFDGFDSGWGLTETEVGLVSVWFRFGYLFGMQMRRTVAKLSIEYSVAGLISV